MPRRRRRGGAFPVFITAGNKDHSLTVQTVAEEAQTSGQVLRGLLEVAALWGETLDGEAGTDNESDIEAPQEAWGGGCPRPDAPAHHPLALHKVIGKKARESSSASAVESSCGVCSLPLVDGPCDREVGVPSSSPKARSLLQPYAHANLFSFTTALEGLSLDEVKAPAQAGCSSEAAELARKLNREEKEYFAGLTKEGKEEVVRGNNDVLRSGGVECIPLRFRVLFSALPVEVKRRVLMKLDKQNEAAGGGDSVKFGGWVECLLGLPLGKVLVPPPDADVRGVLRAAMCHLDRAVYGHREAKQAIVERFYLWMKQPLRPVKPLALWGPPGNGKTSLMKNGLAPAMNRPMGFVSLGGAFDSSYLLGHNYTYEGSQAGRVVDCLTSARAMNPIMYFDELDKISQSPKGDEIANTLIHMTDATQADQFRDRFVQAFPLDLTKVLFVFSFNNIDAVNPILLDRLQLVKTDEFSREDQLKIVESYLFPSLLREAGLEDGMVELEKEAIGALLSMCDASKGVRGVRSVLEQLVSKILMYADTLDEALLFPLSLSDIRICGPREATGGGAGHRPGEAPACDPNAGSPEVRDDERNSAKESPPAFFASSSVVVKESGVGKVARSCGGGREPWRSLYM
jgi:hypothetical protein